MTHGYEYFLDFDFVEMDFDDSFDEFMSGMDSYDSNDELEGYEDLF